MLAKSLKDLFDFQMKRELIYFDDIKLNKTETHFFFVRNGNIYIKSKFSVSFGGISIYNGRKM